MIHSDWVIIMEIILLMFHLNNNITNVTWPEPYDRECEINTKNNSEIHTKIIHIIDDIENIIDKIKCMILGISLMKQNVWY